MKPMDKCEICGLSVDDKTRETVSFRGTVTYVCSRCMHRIISYMTILKTYSEAYGDGKKNEFVDIGAQIEDLKNLLKKQGKRFKTTRKKR